MTRRKGISLRRIMAGIACMSLPLMGIGTGAMPCMAVAEESQPRPTPADATDSILDIKLAPEAQRVTAKAGTEVKFTLSLYLPDNGMEDLTWAASVTKLDAKVGDAPLEMVLDGAKPEGGRNSLGNVKEGDRINFVGTHKVTDSEIQAGKATCSVTFVTYESSVTPGAIAQGADPSLPGGEGTALSPEAAYAEYRSYSLDATVELVPEATTADATPATPATPTTPTTAAAQGTQEGKKDLLQTGRAPSPMEVALVAVIVAAGGIAAITWAKSRQ